MTSQGGLPYLLGVNAILSDAEGIHTTLATFSLPGRVAVVTGGHRGLGLEIALAYAQAGAIVYCVDLPETPNDKFRKVQAYISAATNRSSDYTTGRIEYVSCDVTVQKDILAAMERVFDKQGRLDICVTAAGIVLEAGLLNFSEENFSKVMAVNVNGVVYTAQGASRMMKKSGKPGCIILMASVSGLVANKNAPDMTMTYNATKGAVLQLSRSIACELAPHKIRCNTISPGWVFTDMTNGLLDNLEFQKKCTADNPSGRLGNPEDIAGAALFLASDASIYCNGSNIVIDGGNCAWG